MDPFITVAQFIQRYDWRWVANNLMDDGTVPTLTELLDPSEASNILLVALITDASEMLMSAAAVGARYSEDDLRGYGGNLLIRVVSDLTVGEVLKRRGRALTDEDALSKPYTEALQYLELLRQGERVFAFVPEVPEAGLPSVAPMLPRPGIDPPLLTQGAYRYFGCPAAGWNYPPGWPWCG